MKMSIGSSVWIVLLALPTFFTAPIAASADTYKVDYIGLDFQNNFFVYALESDGTFAASLNGGPCGANQSCYATYTNGKLASLSTTPPPVVADNGSPCSYSVFGSSQGLPSVTTDALRS